MTNVSITVNQWRIIVRKPGTSFVINRLDGRPGKFWLASLIRDGWKAGKDTQSICDYWLLAKKYA